MNGQKLVQNDFVGEWKTEKVCKAEGINLAYITYTTLLMQTNQKTILEKLSISTKENVLYQRMDLNILSMI